MSRCYVYFLIDPAIREPFYIGISNNPGYRFYEHCHDRCSAPWEILNYLLRRGVQREQILRIFKECPDRRSAFAIETQLVRSLPNLVNRCFAHTRDRA
jgi:predicted GIY-YIG superfamily endonuclease